MARRMFWRKNAYHNSRVRELAQRPILLDNFCDLSVAALSRLLPSQPALLQDCSPSKTSTAVSVAEQARFGYVVGLQSGLSEVCGLVDFPQNLGSSQP